jgi:cytoskeleton protein RodZ
MALFQGTKPPFADDTPAGVTPPRFGPSSAGEVLRQRREALGLDLGDVAAALRIRRAYLAALEEGRPDGLPGPAYAIGFMRAYADHLGLDAREVVRRFKQETTLAAKPDLSFPMALAERSIPGSGMLMVAAILAICGYGTWYYLSTGERSRPERVTEVPAALLPPKPEPTVSHPAEALAAPRVSAPTAPSDTPVAAPQIPTSSPTGTASAAALVGVPIRAPQEVIQTAAIAAAPAPQGSSGSSEGPAQIVIRATADSWVQIRDGTRSVLVARVLKPGESYQVPVGPGLSMRTGNAGGLEITVEGNPVPPIGRTGTVRRNVVLDPQALIAGTAVRE